MTHSGDSMPPEAPKEVRVEPAARRRHQRPACRASTADRVRGSICKPGLRVRAHVPYVATWLQPDCSCELERRHGCIVGLRWSLWRMKLWPLSTCRKANCSVAFTPASAV